MPLYYTREYGNFVSTWLVPRPIPLPLPRLGPRAQNMVIESDLLFVRQYLMIVTSKKARE